MEVFFVSQSWPFVVALLLLLLVTIVEGLSVLFGMNASGWVDSMLPDPWDSIHGPIDSWLGWLHVGRVPALVLIVIFSCGLFVHWLDGERRCPPVVRYLDTGFHLHSGGFRFRHAGGADSWCGVSAHDSKGREFGGYV
jgi:hypothetical protein